MYNVDPRLIVAIAGAESSFGTNWVNCAAPPNGFNAWSWFYAGNPPNCPDSPFSSFADGINTVTKFMRRSYLNKGRTTIALIGQRYCSSGCQNWVPNVTTYYSSLGGDTSDLAFVNLFGQWAGTARLTDETGTETLQVSATFLLISGNSFTGTVAVTEPGEMADLNTLTYQALSPISFSFTNNASPMLTTASGSITVTPGQAVLSGSGMDNDPNDPTTGVGSLTFTDGLVMSGNVTVTASDGQTNANGTITISPDGTMISGNAQVSDGSSVTWSVTKQQ